MKIAIDIDDTLTNTKDQQIILWKDYIKKNPNKNYTTEIPDNINSFDDEYISKFWDTYREQLSFTSSFKENADIITNKLHKEGHKLCIVTSRPDSKYDNLKERLSIWFKENNIYVDEINTDIRDKALYCKNNKYDLIIDDSIHHIIEANKLGIKTILFNNIKTYDGKQANNWLDIYKIIKELDS